MKRKIKWFLFGFAALIVVGIVYVRSLLGHVDNHVTGLEFYGQSLESLPEVLVVRDVSRFNGASTYVVARVELVDGREQYYFVADGVVEYYVDSEDVIGFDAAEQIAFSRVGGGVVVSSQLGIHLSDVIYEVQVEYEGLFFYVVIDAQDGEILLEFHL